MFPVLIPINQIEEYRGRSDSITGTGSVVASINDSGEKSSRKNSIDTSKDDALALVVNAADEKTKERSNR